MSKEYLLKIDKSVVKSLKNLPLKIFKQIIIKLFSLQNNPNTIEEEKVIIFRIGKGNDGEVYRNL